MILQNHDGHQPPPQRRRYADCNQPILQILDDDPNRQTINYLRSIAHNLSFENSTIKLDYTINNSVKVL